MPPSDEAARVLPARHGLALPVGQGAAVAVINTHGSQVVDTWAFSADDIEHHMSMQHSRAHGLRLMPAVGAVLYTNRRQPILRLEADTSPGTHDTLIPACDRWRYELLGHVGYHRNCCDNMQEALAALGLRAPYVPAPLNLFMNIPVDASFGLSFEAPTSKPGDRVVLRALRDCILVFSACPQDMVPINGARMQPMDVAIELLPKAP